MVFINVVYTLSFLLKDHIVIHSIKLKQLVIQNICKINLTVYIYDYWK